TFLSYYTWGAGVGLALDLTLRSRFPNVTLDDFMRAMWREHGRAQSPQLAPERPYTLADLRRVLGQVTGDAAFADDFFRRYVEGREVVDYTALLGRAGFLLRKAQAGRAWFGAGIEDGPGGARIAGYPLVTGSLYGAGLDRGDVIVSFDGQPTPTAEALGQAIARKRPGDVVQVEAVVRGGRVRVPMTLLEHPALEVVTYESAGMQVTPAMRAFRAAWLGSRAGR
ncbi:MAG TPA: hypothetical protein VNP72_11335, partial [Longimicrobium sp.]|nr:hypothetical protein [Longimicrobium sp.]